MNIWWEIGLSAFGIAWTYILVAAWNELTAIRKLLTRFEENAARTGRRA